MNPNEPCDQEMINKMAADEKLYNLLKMRFCSYPLLTFFVDYLIDYREMTKIKENCGKDRSNSYPSMLYFLRNILTVIYNIILNLFKRRIMQYDVIFVSRRRSALVRTKERLITSDYLFWSIFEKVSAQYPQIRETLIIADLMRAPEYDNVTAYSFVDFLSPSDLFRSIIRSLMIKTAWLRIEKEIISKYSELNLDKRFFFGFFSLRKLTFLCMLDISITNYTKMLAPKIIVYNDDALFFKSSNDTRLCVLQSARLSWEKERCMQGFYDAFDLEGSYFADYSFVHGEEYRKFSNFKARLGEIIVTGQPRYDIINDAWKVYSREDFCRRYNIKSNNKIILWATQCHGLSNEENIKNFKAIFGAMKNLIGMTLIIKQHPAEGEDYTNMMNSYIHDYKINALITPKNSDTLEQIFISDLMITRASTTAIEAIAMNKPVIVLNLSNEPDPVEYINEGVAKGVYREEDIGPAIKGLLEDDSDLAAYRMAYINKYLYKIDGKATQRVMDIIYCMLEEHRS
jgi:hypothetical protein